MSEYPLLVAYCFLSDLHSAESNHRGLLRTESTSRKIIGNSLTRQMYQRFAARQLNFVLSDNLEITPSKILFTKIHP